MIEGIYNNAASLTTLEKWQASITQNLVASKVAGFKKSNFAIESDDRVKTSYNPEQSAAQHTGGLPVRTTSINFTPGEIEQTQKPTDIAIDGPGFFQIQGADGNNLYTRNGEFQFNNENTLVTRHGLQVMGDGGPITIDPEQGAVTVAKDGTISQGNNLLGRLQLFNFEDPQGLTRVEGGYFEAPDGANPEAVEDGQVVQGAIESSNVLPMEELVSLIQVARAYEASQRSMLSHDDLISKAINSLGSTTA
ncbi:MAG: flagellar hook basal-body protein [Verrucomicrobia bacterium]|jgi:flagellar basal-body rod protein FlgF|nr:flagellar hook basal-body protein [Verrucomicrobiota bacterium]